MATILSLALKVNADASGVVKNLTPAERALENLGKQAAKATSVFDQFAGTSEAAANAQASASKSLADLTDSLKRGDISAEQFARNYAELTAEINKEAAAFKRAAEITKANISPLERYDAAVAELNDQLRAGRITQDTYNRALEKAKTDLDRAGTSAKQTDKSLESLARNTKILAGIEIGRLFIDGLQSLGGVFRDITGRVASLVTSVNGSIDTLNDFAARTGFGVEELQGYSLAAKLAGVDTEQFGAAVQKLAVNIGKATPGDALDKSLRQINLSVKELRALSPAQQFSAIGQAISELPTAADRAAAAVEIFGKQGAALAPLFREGAASLEELQARAERLGIIVSETQVNNVADMNDAFDLVRATIEGIVGQVIGNLAPAVTDVTNQFLRFVESWSGAQGTGGTGIANAITDVLLQGADYFANTFDKFVAEYGGLTGTLETVSASFAFTADVLNGLSATFSAIFNTFELIGNGIAVSLGKVLEGIGSYVSADLEKFGRDVAANAQRQIDQNVQQLAAAGEQLGNAISGALTGGSGNAAAAGRGAASEYLRGLREEIENARRPEVQLELNLSETQERLKQFLAEAGQDASQFLRESVAAVETFQQMAAAGELTAAQVEIMSGFMENVNAELDQELATRRDAAEAATAQADADKKRIDTLLGASDAATKLEQDLQTVQREQARVSAELAAARQADNAAQADAAAARQGELDQLQASLEEQQQALEQGFGQGFQAAFDNVNDNINGLIAKSQEFGQAGFDAALRLQEGIAAAQEQARDGILNAEAFQQEVQRQQELFNAELKHLEDVKRQKDKDAAAAVENQKKQNADLLKAQEQYQREQQTALQAYQQQQQKAQEQYAQEQQRIFDEQKKAAEAEAKRQEERLRKLNTLGDQSLSVADVRSTEGANLVIQTAAQGQDPALIQQRLQTKYLEQIALGIGQAASNYFNQPVAIVGYARFQGDTPRGG